MKKKVTLWLSRDPDGFHSLWRERPLTTRHGFYKARHKNSDPVVLYEIPNPVGGFKIKYGGLARITIERMY